MDTDKFDAVLNLNDPDFVEKFREAVGLKQGEKLQIMMPQFKRTDGLQVPLPQVDFAKLHELSEETLMAIGCARWDEPDANGDTLWLLPYEWYDHIPEGFMLTCIDGKDEPFQRGVTDNDMRCGVLAYGVKRPTPTEPESRVLDSMKG